jgi:hypothetical protein
MVEAILDGWQPEGVTLPELLEGVLVGWREQRELKQGVGGMSR